MTASSLVPPATIAFLGLGMMGRPMAARLAGAGFKLRVFDVSQKAVSDFVGAHPSALATASALSYASADFEARALLGLGQAYRALGDASEAKKTLERVVRVHGATPSAAKATELLKTL